MKRKEALAIDIAVELRLCLEILLTNVEKKLERLFNELFKVERTLMHNVHIALSPIRTLHSELEEYVEELCIETSGHNTKVS